VDIIPSVIVMGAQWGDEAKGKVSDVITSEADCVVKYHGGNNAGTSYVKEDGQKFILHYLSAGVMRDKRSLIAAGVVLNAEDFELELEPFNDLDEKLLGIDPRTHMIMPYHKSMDMAQEHYRNLQAVKAGNKSAMGAIGTTHKGIGPSYVDRKDRRGVTFFELTTGSSALEAKLRDNYQWYQNVIEGKLEFKMVVPKGGEFGAELVHYTEDEMVENQMRLGQKLKKYLTDVSQEVIQSLHADKNVLFQASQGVMLDIDWGNYPKVTSSHPMAGAVPTCVGVPMNLLANSEVFGVIKAYLTKVGSGPVSTCLDGQTWPVDENVSEDAAKHIRAKGAEYGATTKRARRVGWIDLVQLKYAVEVSGITQLAMTKLDVLEGLDMIKLAKAYTVDGIETTEYRSWDLDWLSRAKPVYLKLDGFKDGEVQNSREFKHLPLGAKELVTLVENYVHVPVTLISNGPKASQTILNRDFKSF